MKIDSNIIIHLPLIAGIGAAQVLVGVNGVLVWKTEGLVESLLITLFFTVLAVVLMIVGYEISARWRENLEEVEGDND